MNELSGKHIRLGAHRRHRLLQGRRVVPRAGERAGASVQVVMTEAAGHFITPVTMQALSNRPVYGIAVGLGAKPNNMAHINLGREADAILIAPCQCRLHGASCYTAQRRRPAEPDVPGAAEALTPCR
jgi:phosphopantothenoylcysteine decarboxylase/phosphopantothenate--cysteine ligase